MTSTIDKLNSIKFLLQELKKDLEKQYTELTENNAPLYITRSVKFDTNKIQELLGNIFGENLVHGKENTYELMRHAQLAEDFLKQKLQN